MSKQNVFDKFKYDNMKENLILINNVFYLIDYLESFIFIEFMILCIFS